MLVVLDFKAPLQEWNVWPLYVREGGTMVRLVLDP